MSNAEELTFARVTYTVLAGIGDTTGDVDKNPDLVGVSGTWKISPEIERITLTDAADPATVIPIPIQGTFENGILTYNGDPFVELILARRLTGDLPLFTWKIECEYRYSNSMRVRDSFTFDLKTDSDLTKLRPIPTSTGQLISKGDPGRGYTSISISGNTLVFTSLEEPFTESVTVPALVAAAADAAAAAASAGAASGSASAAAGSASAASGSASSASGSASAADTARGQAVTARTGAETARTGSEAARDAAVTARNAAQAAQTAAETAKTASEGARDTAFAHRNDAQTAKTAAETAQTAAETARTGAQTARTGAETARTGSEGARDTSVLARDAAIAARDAALGHKDAAAASAVAAADSAEQAAEAALGNIPDGSITEAKLNSVFVAKVDSKAPSDNPTFTGTVTGVTKTHVGLSEVTNTSDANKPVSTAQAAADNLRQLLSEKNSANGYAGLDGAGKVAAAQLPSFVDDVIEAANFASLPVTGEAGKIYTTIDNNKIFRWGGSAYVEINPSPSSTDSVAEGTVNLYYTQARADARATAALTARTIATTAPLAGGGNLSANRTLSINARGITGALIADNAIPYDMQIFAAAKDTTRAVGLLDNPFGIRISQACQISSVNYRSLTADASGNLVVELRKNGTTITGTPATIAAANQVAGQAATGLAVDCVSGDIITVYVTGVGTTPGKGLVADITAKAKTL